MGDVATELLKQGPLGIVTLLCVYGMAVLWRKLAERDATITALQESRLQVAQKTAEQLASAASVMLNQTSAIKDLEESLRDLIAESQARRGR
jgi:F420-0:gamma-glutamyl ligase